MKYISSKSKRPVKTLTLESITVEFTPEELAFIQGALGEISYGSSPRNDGPQRVVKRYQSYTHDYPSEIDISKVNSDSVYHAVSNALKAAIEDDKRA